MKEPRPTEAEAPPSFHVVVEAADSLTEEEQETLIELLNRRLADRRRAQLVRDIREAQREFESGALRSTTPNEITKEILLTIGTPEEVY
jgi:polyphosphate kinase